MDITERISNLVSLYDFKVDLFLTAQMFFGTLPDTSKISILKQLTEQTSKTAKTKNLILKLTMSCGCTEDNA
jgi:hypothetical protein